jgi:hypothetical protein
MTCAWLGDARYKKLAGYTRDDFHLLSRLKGLFRELVTTPHVLTEVSNLIGDLPEGNQKKDCFHRLPKALDAIEEIDLPSKPLFARPEYPYLGLTDAGLAALSSRFLVVSTDGRMCKRLSDAKLDALNSTTCGGTCSTEALSWHCFGGPVHVSSADPSPMTLVGQRPCPAGEIHKA